jgi:hypothetical protein
MFGDRHVTGLNFHDGRCLVGAGPMRLAPVSPAGSGMARQEQRKLAETMRALPARFADRMSARTLQQITRAAAAGRWEEAVEALIVALQARAEMVTRAECEGSAPC